MSHTVLQKHFAAISVATEHEEQSAVVEWAEYRPEIRDHLFAIPNGGKRDIRVARKLKAEGVRPGVPDMFLALPRGRCHGLFIEMKSDNGRPSQNQKIWGDRLQRQGYHWVVCRGAQEAIAAIQNYLRG